MINKKRKLDNNIGLDRITPSMLMQYERCPRNFYYTIWLGLELPQDEVHLHFGKAIHLAIDGIFGKQPFDTCLQLFKENFKEVHVDHVPLKNRKEVYLEMILDGELMLSELWNKKDELVSKGVNPTEVEIVFKGELYHPETKEKWPIPMSLRIDGENIDRICEFKTSSKLYNEEETRQSLQAQSYVFTRYIQTDKIKPIDYVVLIKKRKKNKIQHFSIQYTKQEMLDYHNKVQKIFKKIINREFDRPTEGHPYYCDCIRFDNLIQ
jgi:CRISPR/Cas system-associated exonuclease Cas4 (RecB family)